MLELGQERTVDAMKTGRTAAAVEVYQELENNYRASLAEFADDEARQILNVLMHRILFSCKDHINEVREAEGMTAKEYYKVCTGHDCPF
jgi:CRISPR/Cas system-associated endonuclease Cas1